MLILSQVEKTFQTYNKPYDQLRATTLHSHHLPNLGIENFRTQTLYCISATGPLSQNSRLNKSESFFLNSYK